MRAPKREYNAYNPADVTTPHGDNKELGVSKKQSSATSATFYDQQGIKDVNNQETGFDPRQLRSEWIQWAQRLASSHTKYSVSGSVMSDSLWPSWTVAHQVPLPMGFSRQEYWSGQPFPSPGGLLNPGIEPRSLALHADSLPSEPPGKFSNT